MFTAKPNPLASTYQVFVIRTTNKHFMLGIDGQFFSILYIIKQLLNSYLKLNSTAHYRTSLKNSKMSDSKLLISSKKLTKWNNLFREWFFGKLIHFSDNWKWFELNIVLWWKAFSSGIIIPKLNQTKFKPKKKTMS